MQAKPCEFRLDMKSQNGSEYFEQWGEFSIDGPSQRYAAVFGISSKFDGNITPIYWNGPFYTRDRTDQVDLQEVPFFHGCKGGPCHGPAINRGWWGYPYDGPGIGYNPNGIWGERGSFGLSWYMGVLDTGNYYDHIYIYPTLVEIKVRHC